jgi:hypothetical protein
MDVPIHGFFYFALTEICSTYPWIGLIDLVELVWARPSVASSIGELERKLKEVDIQSCFLWHHDRKVIA